MHTVTLVSSLRLGGQSASTPIGAECTKLTQLQRLKVYALTKQKDWNGDLRFEFATLAEVTRFLTLMDSWLRPEFEVGDTRRNLAREQLVVEYRSRVEHEKARSTLKLAVAFGQDSLPFSSVLLHKLGLMLTLGAKQDRPAAVKTVASAHSRSALAAILALLGKPPSGHETPVLTPEPARAWEGQPGFSSPNNRSNRHIGRRDRPNTSKWR